MINIEKEMVWFERIWSGFETCLSEISGDLKMSQSIGSWMRWENASGDPLLELVWRDAQWDLRRWAPLSDFPEAEVIYDKYLRETDDFMWHWLSSEARDSFDIDYKGMVSSGKFAQQETQMGLLVILFKCPVSRFIGACLDQGITPTIVQESEGSLVVTWSGRKSWDVIEGSHFDEDVLKWDGIYRDYVNQKIKEGYVPGHSFTFI